MVQAKQNCYVKEYDLLQQNTSQAICRTCTKFKLREELQLHELVLHLYKDESMVRVCVSERAMHTNIHNIHTRTYTIHTHIQYTHIDTEETTESETGTSAIAASIERTSTTCTTPTPRREHGECVFECGACIYTYTIHTHMHNTHA